MCRHINGLKCCSTIGTIQISFILLIAICQVLPTWHGCKSNSWKLFLWLRCCCLPRLRRRRREKIFNFAIFYLGPKIASPFVRSFEGTLSCFNEKTMFEKLAEKIAPIFIISPPSPPLMCLSPSYSKAHILSLSFLFFYFRHFYPSLFSLFLLLSLSICPSIYLSQ